MNSDGFVPYFEDFSVILHKELQIPFIAQTLRTAA